MSAVQTLGAFPDETGAAPTWQQLADALIEAGIEVAVWVPDKRLAPIGARLAQRGIPLRTLPREEECFAYAADYRAAGGMPLVMVQCSGLGNSLNAIGSLGSMGSALAAALGVAEKQPSRDVIALLGDGEALRGLAPSGAWPGSGPRTCSRSSWWTATTRSRVGSSSVSPTSLATWPPRLG